MTKEEFIKILSDIDLSDKEELEALYDSLKGEFIDKAVDYFCKNWFPTKSIMFVSIVRISDNVSPLKEMRNC